MKRAKMITALFACAALFCTAVLLPSGSGQTAYANTLPVQAYSTLSYEYEGHTFSYEIDSDGESITITGCTDDDAASTVTSLTLPDEIDGVPVEEIADSTFSGYTALEEITLPEGLLTLGTYAFYGCSALTYIDLPDGIKKIPKYCFMNCTDLEGIDFPDNLQIIQLYAFRNCESLASLIFPDTMQTIYDYAFSNCPGITYICFPNATISLRGGNFEESTNVQTVEYAEGCTGLYAFTSTDSFVTDESGTDFFATVQKLILPSTITSLSNISNFASLKEIEISEENESFVVYENGVYNKDYTRLEYVLPTVSEVDFHESVTAIAGGAFTNCSYLTGLAIPEGVTEVASSAISGCGNLETITFPTSAESIESAAIDGCSSLTDVSFYMDGGFYHFTGTDAEGITQLEVTDGTGTASTVSSDALKIIRTSYEEQWMNDTEVGYLAEALETVILPASLESIDAEWFDDMAELTSIQVADGNESFFTQDDILYQYAAAESETYTGSETDCILVRWPLAHGYEEFADDLVAVGDGAFYGCTVIKSLEFPDTLTEVGAKAFYQCTELSIVLGSGLVTIGEDAFRGCYYSSIYLPASVASIGENAFQTGDSSVVMYCVSGSYAESYAIENSITYGLWDGVDTDTAVLAGSDTEEDDDTDADTSQEEDGADEDSSGDGDSTSEDGTSEDGTSEDNTSGDDTSTDDTSGDGDSASDGSSESGDSTSDADSGTSDSDSTGSDSTQGSGTSSDKSSTQSNVKVGTKYTIGSGIYKVTSSTTVTYVGSAKKNPKKVTIPATVVISGKTYQVTAVKASALKNSKKLKSVVIGKNVKTIGKNAFKGCKNLKKITLKGKKVKKIGKNAFQNISKKVTVVVPKGKKAAYMKLLKKAGLSV